MLWNLFARSQGSARVRWRFAAAVALACLYAPAARAQDEVMAGETGGPILLPTTDLAVFESPENRTDLDCKVRPIRPELDFDLRFHAGYNVDVGMRQLAGDGDDLTVVMQVTSLGSAPRSYYFEDHVNVPAIDKSTTGEASITGAFDVGPGRYHVDWLMRDRKEHICSSHWEVEARPDDSLSSLPAALREGEVAPHPKDVFDQQSTVPHDGASKGLHITLLVNFSPTASDGSAMSPKALRAVVSILRSVTRAPGVSRFDLVAFSAQQSRVIYRGADLSQIDFPALGEAVRKVPMGTVDYSLLKDPDSEVKFLGDLLSRELEAESARSDAVIVIGPRMDIDRRVPRGLPGDAGEVRCPIFYLSYNRDPRANPWQDTIAGAVKVHRGLEYSITAPHDFERALHDMMFRISTHN